MNYKIEKNTVQETLIIPLYARKVCSALYNDLKGPSVSGFFRFLAKAGDKMLKMQIVKINF